jgi:hypothetical protein
MDEELLNRITTKISKEQIINYILETWSTPTIIECITTFQQEGLLKKPNDRKINPLSSKEIDDIENTSKGLVYEDPNIDSVHMGDFKDEEEEEGEEEEGEENDEEEERKQKEKRRQQQLIAEKEKERRQQQLIAEKEKERRRQQQIIDEEKEKRRQQLIDEEEERKRQQFVTEVTEEEDERKKKKERVKKPGVLLFKIDKICYILKGKEGYKIISVKNRDDMYSEYKLSYKNKSFFNKFYDMNNELKSLYSVLKKNRTILENIKKINIYEYVLKDGKTNMEKSKLIDKLMEITDI